MYVDLSGFSPCKRDCPIVFQRQALINRSMKNDLSAVVELTGNFANIFSINTDLNVFKSTNFKP